MEGLDNNIEINWMSVARMTIPYKRFVTAESLPIKQSENVKKIELENNSGLEIKQFYENVIRSKSKKPKSHEPMKKACATIKSITNKKIPFDKNRFFRAAMSNDVGTLKQFYYENDLINTTDMFGWTALMMSACENSIDSFKFLLENGAKLITTKTGVSANSIAEQKGFSAILNIIKTFNNKTTIKNIEKKGEKSFENFYCNICDTEFQHTKIKNHETSTVHQFNIKTKRRSSLKYMISNQNRGLKLMVKQGWDEESGLGPTGSGKLFPVKTVIRKGRTGLGIQQNPPKVTHYKPYDLTAIKYKPPQKNKNRNEMRRELKRNQKQDRRLRRELS